MRDVIIGENDISTSSHDNTAFLCGHFADKITLGEKEHIRLYGEELFRSFSKITQYSAAASGTINAIIYNFLLNLTPFGHKLSV